MAEKMEINEQTPIILLDEKNGKVWCITKYLELLGGKAKPIKKFDVTNQLNAVLDKVYMATLDKMQNGVTPKHRTHIVFFTGSTKFRNEYEILNFNFTRDGFIVLLPGIPNHYKDTKLSVEQQNHVIDQLRQTNNSKIEIADMVYVINKGGHINSSTAEDIEYAKSLKKTILYLEPVPLTENVLDATEIDNN